jgi:DnaJ-class molecular chaperone
METCPTCDGTGEVHSHNPKCWTCRGRGVVESDKAEDARESEKQLEDARYPEGKGGIYRRW